MHHFCLYFIHFKGFPNWANTNQNAVEGWSADDSRWKISDFSPQIIILDFLSETRFFVPPTSFAYDQQIDPFNSLIKVLECDEMHMKLQFSLQVRIQPKIEFQLLTWICLRSPRRCEQLLNFHHMANFSKFQNFSFVGIKFENSQ